MKLKIILVMLILGLLAVSNPGMDDFREAAEKKLQQELEKKSEFEQALGSLLGGTLSGIITSKTEHDNYIFFSVFSFDANKKTYRYVGVASQILPLQREMPFENEAQENP